MVELTSARSGFFTAVARALRRYADFEGRSTRAEFWWYALFYTLVVALCGVFDFAALAPAVSVGSVLASLFAIITLLPTLAVGVRRLRDAGEGWKNIFWLLVPVGGLVILAIYWARPSLPEAHEDSGGWLL